MDWQTGDILTAVNIVITGILTFLLWRATVKSNEIADSLKNIQFQEINRRKYFVKRTLEKAHTDLKEKMQEGILDGSDYKEIKEVVNTITYEEIASNFTEKEAEAILNLIDFIEENKVPNRIVVFDLNNPSEIKTQKKKHFQEDEEFLKELEEKFRNTIKEIQNN